MVAGEELHSMMVGTAGHIAEDRPDHKSFAGQA